MLFVSKGTSNKGGTFNMSEAVDETNNDTTGNANDTQIVSSHQVTGVEIEFHCYYLYVTLLPTLKYFFWRTCRMPGLKNQTPNPKKKIMVETQLLQRVRQLQTSY